MDITLSYSSWFILGCIILAGLCTFFLYLLAPKPAYKKSTLIGLSALRFASTFVICWLLLGPSLTKYTNTPIRPELIIAIDNSSSMVNGNDALAEEMDAFSAAVASLASWYDITWLTFGTQVQPDSNITFSDRGTNVGQLLHHVYSQRNHSNTAGLWVVSDGAINQGLNPAYFNYTEHFPIVSLGIGDTAMPTDIRIVTISHNDIVYVANDFEAHVQVAAHGMALQEGALAIYKDGKKIATKPVRLTKEQESLEVVFRLSANEVGMALYRVVLEGFENDQNDENNSANMLVNVVESANKILVVSAGIHPDLSAMAQALDDANTSLTWVKAGDKLPPLDGFSIALVHGFGANAYHPVWQTLWDSPLPLFLVVPGYQDAHRLDRYFSLSNEDLGRGKITAAGGYVQASFGLFTVNDELNQFLTQMPPLHVNAATNSAPKGAHVFLNQTRAGVQTPFPLWFFMDRGTAKTPTAVVAADGLWRWRIAEYDQYESQENFNQLIQKSVQLIAAKTDQSRFKLQVAKQYASHLPATIGAQVYSKALEPISKAQVEITLRANDTLEITRQLNWDGQQYAVAIDGLTPGVYQLEAKAEFKEETLRKSAAFAVTEVHLEQANTRADWQVLQKMAQLTGGTFMPFNQSDSLIQAWNAERAPQKLHQEQEQSSVLSEFWLLGVLLIWLTTEWAIRKFGTTI